MNNTWAQTYVWRMVRNVSALEHTFSSGGRLQMSRLQEMNGGKWCIVVQNDCQHSCLYLVIALDEIYEKNKKNYYNPYIFTSVIWQEIYLQNENVSFDVLYLWSKYIYDQTIKLKNVSDFEFLNGYWKFGDLPTIYDREQTKNSIDFIIKNISNDYDYHIPHSLF